MSEVMIHCLTCPLCGEPPLAAFNPKQAFCGNSECPAICWDMTMTFAANRTGMTLHDFSDFLRAVTPEPPDS